MNKTVHLDLGREPTDPAEARAIVRICRTELALLMLAAALTSNDELEAVTAEARAMIERTRGWRQSGAYVR
jgi:hypothetical protein